jgi:hypothetical protein
MEQLVSKIRSIIHSTGILIDLGHLLFGSKPSSVIGRQEWQHRGADMELTIELLEDALNGARAAATAHRDIELVLMVDHFVSVGM